MSYESKISFPDETFVGDCKECETKSCANWSRTEVYKSGGEALQIHDYTNRSKITEEFTREALNSLCEYSWIYGGVPNNKCADSVESTGKNIGKFLSEKYFEML